MTIALQYTVEDVLSEALSNIGVEYANTEAANRQHAHRQLNLLLGAWSADPDLMVGRIVPLSGYTELSDTVDLPPEYVSALMLNLAVKLGPHYDQPTDKVLLADAAMAMDTLKRFNIQRITCRIPSNGTLGY